MPARPGLPFPILAESVGLGVLFGAVVALFSVVIGVHGGLPAGGYYLLGPVVWLLPLPSSESAVLILLGTATPLLWTGYWLYLLAGSHSPKVSARLVHIAVIHVASVAAYQIAGGLAFSG